MANEIPPTGKIAAKLVAAMKAVDAVEKKGRNTQQGYSFVRATDVANEVRKALATAGVAFTYSVVSERTWEAPTSKGSLQFFCSLIVDVTFTDAESGESMTARSIGWGGDMQDKAPYKAMTGALKYALRMNFLIPDESDPEAAETHESVPKPQADLKEFEEWKAAVETCKSPGDVAMLVKLAKEREYPEGMRRLLATKAKDLGLVWNGNTSAFEPKGEEVKA